jgi:hypothetical protein
MTLIFLVNDDIIKHKGRDREGAGEMDLMKGRGGLM